MQTGSMMRRAEEEQRSAPRRAVLLRCRVQEGGEEPVQRFTRIADLSVTGARILTASPPDVGEILTLSFQLSERGPRIDAEARVIWRSEGYRGRGGVIGVAFIALQNAAALERFVEGI